MAQTKRIRSFASAVAAVKRLKGIPVPGPRISVAHRAQHLRLSIEQFRALAQKCKPAKCQRQTLHRWITGKAKYLQNFELPQIEFAVCFSNGEYYMANGNHRTLAWFTNDALPKPDYVDVMFFDADGESNDSDAEMRAIYNCYDARGPAKTVAHELLSYMRECGVDIEKDVRSHFILSGKWKGSLEAIMGASGARARKQGVTEYLPELLIVDTFGLEEKKSLRHSAVAGAAIVLLRRGHSVKLVHAYVNEFVRLKANDLFGMPTCIPEAEAAAVKAFQSTGRSGSSSSEGAIKAHLPVYVSYFDNYCRSLVIAGPVSLATLAKQSLKKKAA